MNRFPALNVLLLFFVVASTWYVASSLQGAVEEDASIFSSQNSYAKMLSEKSPKVLSKKKLDEDEERLNALRKQEQLAAALRQRLKDEHAKEKVLPRIRQWVYASGKKKVDARISHIEDRSSVVLIGEDGNKIAVPLSQLSSKDIYSAVEFDFKKRQREAKEKSEASVERFEKRRINHPQTIATLIDNIEMYVAIIESDKDVTEKLNSVLHPDAFSIAKSSGLLRTKEAKEKYLLRLRETIAGIDFDRVEESSEMVLIFNKKGGSDTLRKYSRNVWRLY